MITTTIYIALQVFTMIVVAPFINGVIKKVKALTQKRKGAPLLQMYYDLYKLFHKGAVVSDVSSWIFKATPYIVFSSTLVAAILVPVTARVLPTNLPGDIIMLFYLLALGRFFTCLAALDTGSTFGGMGSSREAMISSLIEPSIIVTVFTVGLIAKSTSISSIMVTMMIRGAELISPVFLTLLMAVLIIILAETSRIPVDDPATHLELTMVHEAMILEYSGRHLALMELGALIKQLVFMTLLVNIFLPHDQLISLAGAAGVLVSLVAYFIKITVLAIIIALIEVNTVKLRFFSIPNLAALSFILSFLGFMQYFVLGR